MAEKVIWVGRLPSNSFFHDFFTNCTRIVVKLSSKGVKMFTKLKFHQITMLFFSVSAGC